MAGRRKRPPAARSQHFLRSRRLAAELVREAGIGSTDYVVEIGAGTGLLTAELARRSGRLDAVELDARLAESLTRRFASRAHVDVVAGDALARPLPPDQFRVVANLPFHVTADALRYFLDDPLVRLQRADLIVAWPAACKRARVWPSTLLGVSWGAWYTFAVARRLPAAAFAPRPSVDAGVLVVTRRAVPLVPVSERHAFRSFVRAGFAAPRLDAGLGPRVSRRAFRRASATYAFGRDATARELDVHQWAGLYATSREPSA